MGDVAGRDSAHLRSALRVPGPAPCPRLPPPAGGPAAATRAATTGRSGPGSRRRAGRRPAGGRARRLRRARRATAAGPPARARSPGCRSLRGAERASTRRTHTTRERRGRRTAEREGQPVQPADAVASLQRSLLRVRRRHGEAGWSERRRLAERGENGSGRDREWGHGGVRAAPALRRRRGRAPRRTRQPRRRGAARSAGAAAPGRLPRSTPPPWPMTPDAVPRGRLVGQTGAACCQASVRFPTSCVRVAFSQPVNSGLVPNSKQTVM